VGGCNFDLRASTCHHFLCRIGWRLIVTRLAPVWELEAFVNIRLSSWGRAAAHVGRGADSWNHVFTKIEVSGFRICLLWDSCGSAGDSQRLLYTCADSFVLNWGLLSHYSLTFALTNSSCLQSSSQTGRCCLLACSSLLRLRYIRCRCIGSFARADWSWVALSTLFRLLASHSWMPAAGSFWSHARPSFRGFNSSAWWQRLLRADIILHSSRFLVSFSIRSSSFILDCGRCRPHPVMRHYLTLKLGNRSLSHLPFFGLFFLHLVCLVPLFDPHFYLLSVLCRDSFVLEQEAIAGIWVVLGDSYTDRRDCLFVQEYQMRFLIESSEHLRVDLSASWRLLLDVRILLGVISSRTLLVGHRTREDTRLFWRLLWVLIVVTWLEGSLVVFIWDGSRSLGPVVVWILSGRKKRALFLLRLTWLLLSLSHLGRSLFLELELNYNIIRRLSGRF